MASEKGQNFDAFFVEAETLYDYERQLQQDSGKRAETITSMKGNCNLTDGKGRNRFSDQDIVAKGTGGRGKKETINYTEVNKYSKSKSRKLLN